MPESEKTDIPDFDEQTSQIENKKQTEHENNTIIAFTPAADDEINRQKKLDSIDDVIIPEDESQKNIIWPDDTDVTQIIEDEIPEENLKDTETAQETEVTENTNDIENPEEMQIVQEIELNETPEEKVDFNDVIEPQEESETENETSEEISDKQDYEVQDIGNDEIPDDTGLPELNFDFPGDDSKEVLENAEKDFNQTDSKMPEDFFDIDNPLQEKNSDNEIETNIEENPFDHAFDDFDNDFETASENNVYNETSSSAKGPLSFTGLYDKETELGLSEQDEKITKKTKGPVIICIICAIICVIATLLILFIVPSKYNLLHKGNSQKEQTEITEITVEDQPQIEPEPEIAEPIPPQAQEEEVVVVEQAEIVVPEQPPVTPEKPKDINYKIKWGDTLWDIADTYYKNPWRYKYIAKFNHIKDPDYIISGTYITIPAE